MAKKFSELPSASALTGTEIVALVQDGVSKRTTSQDIADLTQTFFRGKYISLAALEAAIPTGEDGDYAIVDAGSGTDASQYIWDADEGWVQSSGVGTVVSITGDGVDNTDPSNPVITFPVASEVDFTPSGTISSTNVQDAIEELGTEKQAALGFTPENVSNKATDLTSPDNTKYPTTQAVATAISSAVTGLWDDRGNYDASGNIFPSSGGSGAAGAILKGDVWTISVAGTLGGTSVSPGDTVRALVDTPGSTSSNWAINAASSGSTTPNASTTVAGKVEMATSAETIARTASGGTGAALAVGPAELADKLRANRTVTGTDSIIQADSEKLIYFNSATDFNFTIDQLVIDSYVSFKNIGSGIVTLVAGTGVTLSGGTRVPPNESGVILYRTATNPVIGVSNDPTITSTVLSGTELKFDRKIKKHTKTIDENVTLSLAGTGNIADCYIILTTTGDETHILSFPGTWIMLGDGYDSNKIQEITFRYTGTYVIGCIVTLNATNDLTAPTLSSALIPAINPNNINLTFNEPVNISTAGWSVSASGGAVTISSVLSGNGTDTPVFLLSRLIGTGETVTISYDPGTGNTTDSSGNELATISGAAVTNNAIILLYDEFSDGTIDPAKWAVTDPADGVTISEVGSRLRFSLNVASPVASTNTNHVDSVSSFGTTPLILRASAFHSATGLNSTALFKLYNSGDSYATARQTSIGKSAGATPKATLNIYNGSTFIYQVTTSINFHNTAFKITYSATHDIKFYYWDGSAWVQMGTTQNFDLGGSLKVSFGANCSGSDTGTPTLEFDTLYLTNTDYSTVVPL